MVCIKLDGAGKMFDLCKKSSAIIQLAPFMVPLQGPHQGNPALCRPGDRCLKEQCAIVLLFCTQRSYCRLLSIAIVGALSTRVCSLECARCSLWWEMWTGEGHFGQQILSLMPQGHT